MSGKKSFSDLLKNTPVPVLVDFYADWCGPCKTLSPLVQQVASDLHDRIKVIKVNVDKNRHAATKYNISGIPTLMLFYRGNILWRRAGLISKKELMYTVEQHLKATIG